MLLLLLVGIMCKVLPENSNYNIKYQCSLEVLSSFWQNAIFISHYTGFQEAHICFQMNNY